MKTLIDLITEQVTNAFTGQGYDAKYGKVTLSNRPDLCEYQCNGAMAAAKEYKCAPFMISDKIAQALAENELFESVESVKPGFINMKVSPAYLAKYVSDMKADEGRFGCDKAAHPAGPMLPSHCMSDICALLSLERVSSGSANLWDIT